MSDFAYDLGSAVCASLDAAGFASPHLCGDPAGTLALGSALLVCLGAAIFGLATIDRPSVSEFVRRAIAERIERRPPSAPPERKTPAPM